MLSLCAFLSKASALLSETIVTNLDFQIQLVSHDLLCELDFSLEQLKGKSLNYITGNEDVVTELKARLCDGYLSRQSCTLFSKDCQGRRFILEGYRIQTEEVTLPVYLLNFRKIDVISSEKARASFNEIDQFIYHVSHDLRGPLATIQGLIRLLTSRNPNTDSDAIIQLLDTHTQKLDERLFHLVYLSKATSCYDHDRIMSQVDVRKWLSELMCKPLFCFLKIDFSCSGIQLKGVQETIFKDLVENLLLFLARLLPAESKQVAIAAIRMQEAIQITFCCSATKEMTTLIDMNGSDERGYAQVMRNPLLLHYYAARKVLAPFGGRLNAFITDASEIKLTCVIPVALSTGS
jgi:hypothetical protein